MEVKQEIVEIINRQKIEKYTIINDNGVQVGLLTLGATWQEFLVPDDKGGQKNLIIGFDEPSDYLKSPLCAGQSIGRVAGRINQGKVNLDGKEIQLPQNEKGNTLHGGPKGFHKHIWQARVENDIDKATVVMTYNAKESVDGFPGDMLVTARFTLDNDNRFTITYTGKMAVKRPSLTQLTTFTLTSVNAKTWHTIPLLWLLTVTWKHVMIWCQQENSLTLLAQLMIFKLGKTLERLSLIQAGLTMLSW